MYNRKDAVDYAQKYALSRNPNYYDFSNLGGDCTNYMSQCLFAGLKKMSYNPKNLWYYHNLNDRSYSWTSVKFLQDFLLYKDDPTAKIVSLSDIIPGDIIQLKNSMYFFHSLFVTHVNGNEILVCAHSIDSLNRPLSSYSYNSLLPLHIIK